MRSIMIAATQCNWTSLDNFTEETLGFRASRSLQGTVITSKELSAYPAALSLSDPLHALSTGHHHDISFEHGHLSFALQVEDDSTPLRLAIAGFKVTFLARDVMVISASYEQWFTKIVNTLKGGTTEYEEFLTFACVMMENVGFRHMFIKYPRKLIKEDGATIIAF